MKPSLGYPSLLALALALAGAAGAQTQARSIQWPSGIERPPQLTLDPGGVLEIDARAAADLTLVEIDDPGLSQPYFGLRLRLRHAGVTPEGFIQMDAQFAPGEVYFSRQPLAGDAPWRVLELPFNATEPDGTWHQPTALRLRLILPGGGRVGVAEPVLVEAAAWGELMRRPGAWWSAEGAAWIGVAGGVLFGTLGAVIGILIGRGRARGLAMTLCWLAAALGLGTLVIGLIALALGQDYAVYFPLLLTGALGTTIFPLLALRSRTVYAQGELRRMRARDSRP